MDVSVRAQKAECSRLQAFELWCWRRLLRAPCMARRPNQSILKETSPKDWCWKWSSNILATWWKESTHQKRPWCWERLKAGGAEDDRGWDGWMASPTRWTWIWVNSGSWWWTGRPGVLRLMGSQRSDMTSWLNNSTYIKGKEFSLKSIFLQKKKYYYRLPGPCPPCSLQWCFCTYSSHFAFLAFCFLHLIIMWKSGRFHYLLPGGFLPTVYKHHNI